MRRQPPKPLLFHYWVGVSQSTSSSSSSSSSSSRSSSPLLRQATVVDQRNGKTKQPAVRLEAVHQFLSPRVEWALQTHATTQAVDTPPSAGQRLRMVRYHQFTFPPAGPPWPKTSTSVLSKCLTYEKMVRPPGEAAPRFPGFATSRCAKNREQTGEGRTVDAPKKCNSKKREQAPSFFSIT